MAQKINHDTIPVRSGEELNLHQLESFLRGNIEGIPEGDMEVLQFSAGHSNLTYQIKVGDWEAVLRRPPLGPVAPKAHDMGREFKVISEIHPLFPPAPKPFVFSEDENIVGSPFFIMERKHGVVLDTEFPAGVEATRDRCRAISEIMVDRLVDLHSIDYKQTGLVNMVKPEGFMERQVYGWIKRYQRSKTDEIQEVDVLTNWLSDHIPAEHDATIIHYDYKLNNSMFDEEFSKMVGLFDWEMTTVGDPLADLGVAMSYWTQDDDPKLLKYGLSKPSVTVLDGFMTRQEFIEAYAKKSGRDVTNMNFYLTFGYFKLAVICQQIYYRYRKGQTNDQRFARFNETVQSLISHGTHIANGELS